ncbi:hypothetical protein BDV38DRAFT_273617 [Aspergillus pseudotamarii]|uniref:Uncharacterized protein n=1 Tax=Aspergillus pseudotamarii TaxID=132259 RepID=A0A5N6SL77_ASPPS|nr:uncharacterized protein BDV38DRAFT_273617 [Aspergillus pseudotamarii]KAE8134451.1 hypothetical protein BDV38DRAFT_273617 [Aspergillus pseudotamarii]
MSKGNSEQSSLKQEEIGSTVVPKPTLFQRWKAHMKKWWWLYLIGLGCIVLVTVLPLVYVGVPNIANDRINKYKFDFDGLSITNPTPNSFHVRQSQQFHVGMGSGHLSEFDASIYYSGSDTSFAVLPFPRIDFGNDAYLDIDQDLDLSCVSCFSKLAEDAVRNEEISVLITGKPSLKVQALPTAHLDIHKTVTLPEFMKRDDAFNVTKLDLLNPRMNDGYNVNATIVFNTPAAISVELGTVSFNLTIDDSELGYIDIPDLTLRNGTSTAVVLGDLDIQLLIRKGLWESSNSNYGKVTIGIHGNRSVYNGEEIPYFTAAVKAISASTTVDLFDYVSDILGG